RELLLFTIAASALLALIASHTYGPPNLQPSSLVQEFGLPDRMDAVAQRCNLPAGPRKYTGGTHTVSGKMLSRHVSYRLDLPPDSRNQLLNELRSDAQQMLHRGDYSIIYDNDVHSHEEGAGFFIMYRGPYLCGQLIVRRFDVSDDQMDLIIFAHENLER
ncbi:MAG TPA: hypothetical protein VMP01_00760, partial [Pirellulaceae bacterium]|nr:hypothetical protein [Pirellulaceae bacterium]